MHDDTVSSEFEAALQAEAARQGVTVAQLLHRRLMAEHGDLPDRLHRLRYFFDAALDMMVMARHGQLIDFNPAMMRTLGYDRETLLQTNYIDLVHPDDREATLAVMQQQAQGIPTKGFENRYRHADGHYLRFEWTSMADDNGTLYGIARDVTDFHDMHMALKHKTEEVTTILESIGDAFFALDDEWRFIYVNQRAQDILQQSADDLMGQSLWQAMPAARESIFQERYERVRQTQQTDSFVAYYAPLATWFEITVYPAAHGLSVYFHDVTERIAMQHELRLLNTELEQRVQARTTELDALINTLPDYIFMVERETTRILYCNDAFAHVIGYDNRKTVYGKTIAECFPPEQAAYYIEQNNTVFGSGETLHINERLVLPGGDFHMDTYKIPLRRYDGRIYAVLGTSRDITELVETRRKLDDRTEKLADTIRHLRTNQQLLRSIFDSQTASIAIIDDTGEITMVNQAWRLRGRANRAQDALIKGRGMNYLTACDNSDSEDARIVAARLRQLLADDISDDTSSTMDVRLDNRFTHEYLFTTPAGDHWYQLQAVRFQSQDGPQVVISHEDITPFKISALETLAMLQRERELRFLTQNFIMTVSHEFRTPMAIMQTSIELIRRYSDRLTPERRDMHLTKMENQLKRLTHMIEDISTVHRGQLHINDLHLTPVMVGERLRQIADEVKQAFQYDGPLLVEQEDERRDDIVSSPAPVMLDEVLLHQMMTNLLSNAIKYSHAGGVVRIIWRQTGDVLRIQVMDEGIGIPVMEQKRLFEPFFRAGNVGTISGTGLGLSIVQQAAMAMNGTVELVSHEGRGTLVTIVLPIARSHDEQMTVTP